MEIVYRPIGTVHSPFKVKEDIKKARCIDPRGFDSVQGQLEIFSEFSEGLKDIDGFSHIILIFAFHKAEIHRVTVLTLLKRKGNVLRVSGVDMIEGTPILDIKPYTPKEQKPGAKFGWLGQWVTPPQNLETKTKK